jgi:hypothetical protein
VTKRILVSILSVILLATSAGLQSVGAQTNDTAAAAKARAKVESMGLGSNAKVEVKLQDETKLKGYLSAKEHDSFTITDAKTGATSTVRYAEVVEVKKAGGGFSTKGWIILGAAAAGAITTWFIVKPVLCDGGAQSRGPC